MQAKEFLYEQPAFPESEYLFKHALTQDVAYGTVLQEQRKTLHERTGRAMEGLYRTSLSDHYNELAHHYGRSGNAEKAVEYLGLAGHQAVQRSANDEAIEYLTSALQLLTTLPDSPERNQHELALQVTLGVPLTATKSWGAPEVENVYFRARELCEQVGDTPELFPTLFGLWAFYFVRAEYKTAHELCEQLLRLAHSQHDPALLLEAHLTLGATLYSLGELASGRTHLAQGNALYDSQQHHSLAFIYGSVDPGVVCLCHTTRVLWLLGYPEQALRSSHEAVALAQELAHPFSLGFALSFTAGLHQLRRERHLAQDGAEAAVALSTEQGFPHWLAGGTMLQGWALAEQGHGAAGLSQIREGLAAHRATGAEISRSHYLALLAEAYGKDGQVENGLSTVVEALAFVERTEERFYEAELYRLKGELVLQKFKVQSSRFKGEEEAEAYFHKALEVARQQEAKSWELRAATSLAQLWQGQGKTTEARELLAPVYGWFTEGFDTADLKDAKALLNELS